MIFHKENVSDIAKERLKLMMETETFEYSSNDISRLKKEISALVSRYFDMSTDMFEVKITLKPKNKR
jgi:septum formation topological specificity factor MinE